MKKGIYLFISILFMLFIQNAFCQVQTADPEIGTGLETGGDKRIYVLIDILGEDAKELGLSRNRIRSKVELRLRQNGLIPRGEAVLLEQGYLLDVIVRVVDNAFSIEMHFRRFVIYKVGNKEYAVEATTWFHSGTGTHTYSSKYIIESLLDSVDIFCADFLRANEL